MKHTYLLTHVRKRITGYIGITTRKLAELEKINKKSTTVCLDGQFQSSLEAFRNTFFIFSETNIHYFGYCLDFSPIIHISLKQGKQNMDLPLKPFFL